MLTRCLLLAFAFASAWALTGCRESKVAHYRVRKEAPPSPPSVAPAAGDVDHPHWTPPSGWVEQPATSVRVGSFLIQSEDGRKAELVVTQFPGEVGGDLANVNRWRGQLQLPPISAEELGKHVSSAEFPSGTYFLTDLTSEQPLSEGNRKSRILGAWLKTPERTWFYKLTGDAELVGAQRDAFHQFLHSVTYHIAEESESATKTSAAAPLRSGAGRALTWRAPADWKAKPPTPMRKGSFAVPGASGGEADLSIISFPGDAGGIAENLNRWRGQVQLPPVSAEELASTAHTLARDSLRFTIVDYTGKTEQGPWRILGAVLPLENETYFFKLAGPESVVAERREAFLEFLKTIKLP